MRKTITQVHSAGLAKICANMKKLSKGGTASLYARVDYASCMMKRLDRALMLMWVNNAEVGPAGNVIIRMARQPWPF